MHRMDFFGNFVHLNEVQFDVSVFNSFGTTSESLLNELHHLPHFDLKKWYVLSLSFSLVQVRAIARSIGQLKI